MPLAPGTHLGPYEITARIGMGGMGEVWRATDTNLGRQVAIKVLPDVFAHDADRLTRFEREAKTLASLNHPNIAIIHGLEKADGARALVMELVDGPTLAYRIATGPLALTEVLDVAAQIVAGLEAAHGQGIIHRDLKPSNIKVRPDGTVKILDFGLAKGLDLRQGADARDIANSPTITSPAMTQAGMILGTAAYMSPEQAKGLPVDKRADIWAFGVVLYEMLAGRRPFDGDDIVDVLGAVARLEPKWDTLPFDVPPPIRVLLEGCLMKDRRQRVGDMSVARFVLEKGASLAARHATPADVPAAPPSLWRRALPLVAALAIAAFSAGAGIWFAARPAQTSEAVAVVRFELPIPGGVGSQAHFALSPDGQHIAIAAPEDGQLRLRVRPLAALEARLLPGAEGARFPFWKPDGKEIGFVADGKLKSIPLAGGSPGIITNVDPVVLGATWSQQGVIVFSQGRELYTVNERGGASALLYRGPGIPFEPVFLPDGRHFLYREDGIFVGALDGSPPVQILPAGAKALYSEGHLLFKREGRLVAQPFDADARTLSGAEIPITSENVIFAALSDSFSVAGGVLAYQASALEQLAWKDRAGTVTEKVGGPQQWRNFRLSPNQAKIALDVSIQGRIDVAMFDLQRGTLERFTSQGGGGLVPVFSPDGTQMAFTSMRSGRFNPYITSAPNQERLIADVGTTGGYPVDWSPNGKYLLTFIGVTRISGSSRLTPRRSRTPSHGLRSRKGTECSILTGGGLPTPPMSRGVTRSTWHHSRRRAARYAVSSQGGSGPAWRRDGKELFYVAGDGRLTAVPVMIRGSSVELGRAESLFPVTSSEFHRAYELSRDGQRVLVATPAADGGATITVLLNWRRMIEK